MGIARNALMSHSKQRSGGSPSHWAVTPRARGVIIFLSLAACGGSQQITGDDDGVPPSDADDSPSTDSGSATSGEGSAITVAISGPGRITSTPAGIDCGNGGTACTARFSDKAVVLTTDGATTVRWSGACSGNGDCAVALGADRAVTAETFAPLRVTFDGADHGSDACNAIAAGAGDSIIVAGSVQRFSQGDDAWAGGFDASGHALWSYELSTPSEGHDLASGVVALSDGSARIAGTWFSGSNSQWNSFVLDFDAGGALAGSQLSEAVGEDRYAAIARDAGGRLFVAGSQADASGQAQAWIRALASDGGSELWAVHRDGTAPGADHAAGVAVDSAGAVVAVGSETNATTGTDGWIAKYSPDGALRWSAALAGPDADWLADVAVGPDDGVAAVGGLDGASSIRAYTAAGAPRWDVTAADGTSWAGVAIDAAGDVVVAGSLGADLVVRKYSPAGALIWQRIVDGASGQAVAIDGHGRILVCGATTKGGASDGLILGFPQ